MTVATVAACIAELTALLGAERVRTDAAELKRRSHDVSYHEPHPPHAVVYAACEADIAVFLRTCNKHKVPVIAVSGGTSLEGHIIPTQTRGAVILDLTQMDKIVAVHDQDLDCVVEPGVGWIDLREHLEPSGLFFPPDPGSSACVGGMCGTNCSGTLAWRYGTMKDHVLSLRVVLPDGTVVKTRQRATKSSAGYDLTRLFVGSEGTLGIVSQATLRLRRIPVHTAMVLAQFKTLEDAGSAVADVVHKGPMLNRMELMDDYAIRSVNITANPDQRYAEQTTILFECAGPTPAAIAEQIASLETITAANRCTLFRSAKGESESERLWHLRKRAYFAAKDLRRNDKGVSILTTDVAVPISHLVAALSESRRDLDAHGLTASIVAHAGDGNFHVLLVVNPSDPKEVAAAQAFRDRNARMALAFGGTCTGEHGIGIGKIHLLEEEVGLDAVHLMRRLKATIDPNGIMNPGKVFTELPNPSTPCLAKSKL
ncbi:hypothetical protein BC831DRAFT_424098 [Entophlyctis helioformis]|nr:hypothetical protein BC831DRAFT_424098 [Entophlyctis helioformis]